MALNEHASSALEKMWDKYNVVKHDDVLEWDKFLKTLSLEEALQLGLVIGEFARNHDGMHGLNVWDLSALIYFMQQTKIDDEGLRYASGDDFEFSREMVSNTWLMAKVEEFKFRVNDDRYLLYPCDDPCQHCNDCCDGDSWTVVTAIDKKGGVSKSEDWCESCYEGSSFYCEITDESYDGDNFIEAETATGTTVCAEAVKALGWKLRGEHWHPPEKEKKDSPLSLSAMLDDASVLQAILTVGRTSTTTATSNTITISTEAPMPDSSYAVKDFYWALKKGGTDRTLNLMLEESEQESDSNRVKKIYARIEEAGADKGDPDVLNVYTRLHLIDEKLLDPKYRL